MQGRYTLPSQIEPTGHNHINPSNIGTTIVCRGCNIIRWLQVGMADRFIDSISINSVSSVTKRVSFRTYRVSILTPSDSSVIVDGAMSIDPVVPTEGLVEGTP